MVANMEMTKFLISRITNSNVTEELEIMAGDRAHAIAQHAGGSAWPG